MEDLLPIVQEKTNVNVKESDLSCKVDVELDKTGLKRDYTVTLKNECKFEFKSKEHGDMKKILN